MALLSSDLGIDLGTIYTRIAEGGEVILEEPTVVAIAVEEQKIVAVGKEAQEMEGRVPESIEVVRPLQNGVVAYYEITEKLLSYLIRKVSGPLRFFRPRVMITVPFGVTSVESRAVHEAALQAGSREVFLIQQPLAAALGADLPIGTPSGNMIVSLGGGCSQAAVLAMNGIVAADTLRTGGMQLDEAVISYIRKKYGLIIGQPTAEQIKIRIGAAYSQDEELHMEIQGQDQVTGLPRPLTLTTEEVVNAVDDTLHNIINGIRRVLEKTPPELVSDTIDRGIALCSGGSLLRGVDKLITKELGVPAYLVDNPTLCAAYGAARGLTMYPALRRNLPQVA
ncbi:MAG TPA: rod shape-determining protein [Anaerolineales bacterium]|nr:rod shape-determining protein [Anaerolineales bacterium]